MKKTRKIMVMILSGILCMSLFASTVRADEIRPKSNDYENYGEEITSEEVLPKEEFNEKISEEESDSGEIYSEEAEKDFEINSEVKDGIEKNNPVELNAGSNPYSYYAKNPDGSWANCTWWCWKLVYDNTGIALNNWGNAGDWYSRAQAERYICNNTPSANSIAVWKSGYYGHVAYVTAVSGTSIYIKQGGVGGTTDGYGERWYYDNDAYGYIHLDAGPTPSGQEMTSGYDRVLPDGDYIIASAGSTDKTKFLYLDIYGSEFPAASSTNVNVHYLSDPPEQDVWTLKYESGFYTITQKGAPGISLDVQGASRDSGANVMVSTSHSGSNQRWAISQNERNGYRVQSKCSGFSLDVKDANFQNGTNVQMCQNNNTDAQSWLFIPYMPSQPISNGRYILLSALNNNYIMDVAGETGDVPNCQNIQLWADNTQNKFNEFEAVKLSNGYYKFVHVASKKVIDVTNGLCAPGSNIALYDDNGSIAQQWTILKCGSGYTLVSRCSGMALDVSGGAVANGTNIALYYRNNSNAQIWSFVDGEYQISYNVNGGKGSIEPQTKYYKNNINLTTTVPKHDEKKFLGWATYSFAEEPEYLPGAVYSKDQSMIMYAVWEVEDIYPETISLDKNTAALNIGEELALIPTFTPETVTTKTVTWESSKPAVATVENGIIRAKSSGTTIISAKTINNLTARCEVIVYAESEPYEVGDIIKFGKYEQDGDMSNGKEDIAWQILKVESDRVLVISKYALDQRRYSINPASVTWENCYLREWLNNGFKNAAFTSAEQAKIPTVNIANKDNPRLGTADGNNTNDQIFCLSLEEMESYFGNYSCCDSENMYGYNQNLICAPTQYADNNGAYAYTITEDVYNSFYKDKGYTCDVIGRSGSDWWLRTTGASSYSACYVRYDGLAGANENFYVERNLSVRPALYIDLSVVVPESINLDKTTASLTVGEEMTLTAMLTPDEVTEKTITWTSSNPAVVTVTDGVVKAISAGEATITAKTANDLTATCEVTVIGILPESISLDITSATLVYGEGIKITPTLTPSNVTEKTVEWTSSNEMVAIVSNGYVKATHNAGTTIITAKTINGLTAECKIIVQIDNNQENIFADIKYESWQYNAIRPVYDKGYMTGKGMIGDKVWFAPNDGINRSQFAVALYSIAGKPEVTYEQKFSDVKEGAWYAKAVTWAEQNGIVAGNADGSFGINGKATREQMALMFYKYAVYCKYNVDVDSNVTLETFTDANTVHDWALPAVKWAVSRGIISGKGNAESGYRIDPTAGATRAECAAMMNKFSQLYDDSLNMLIEELEEPLALPEEDMEELSLPADETEDVIIDEEEETEDEDVPFEDEEETDEGEINPEEEAAEE